MRSPNEPQRPDYSRTNFEPKTSAANADKEKKDIFGDILGEQGYSFGSKMNQGPRTINAMRKEEMVKEMDPERVKIIEWVSELSMLNYQ
jgi:cyclin G-associated kinase